METVLESEREEEVRGGETWEEEEEEEEEEETLHVSAPQEPLYLFSPSSVLQSQRATCFESAALLCSLLLGAHYDAYCVSGYAVKQMCLLDLSLQECPLQDTEVKSVTSEQEPQEDKYTVKHVRELKSHLLMQQEKKKQDAEAASLQKQKLQEETRELQRKQQWYQKNQLHMTKEEEEEYQTYCSEKTLQIHVAKKRLVMHKEAASQKYQTLDQKLKRDPRLAPHLLG